MINNLIIYNKDMLVQLILHLDIKKITNNKILEFHHLFLKNKEKLVIVIISMIQIIQYINKNNYQIMIDINNSKQNQLLF
jgi:hypothetical protein